MNIGQMLRSVIGEFQAAEGKMLELKAGQIVRGVILQLLADQDALININGVPVRAALETSLPVGQATFFQVQPKSDDGRIVLKPLAFSDVPIAEQTQAEVLRSIGLKDTEVNRRALKELSAHQLPVNRDSVTMFAEALTRKPETVPEGQWKEAVLLAVRRGLPATAETVGALRQSLFGKPLDQTLAGLDKQIAGLLTENSTDKPLPAPARELLVRVKQELETLASPDLGTGDIESESRRAGSAERNGAKPELPQTKGSGTPAFGSEAEAAPEEPGVFRSSSERSSAVRTELKPAADRPDGQVRLSSDMPLSEGAKSKASVQERPALVPERGTAGTTQGGAKPAAQGETNAERPAPIGGTHDAAAASGGKAAPREAALQQEAGSWIPRLLKALGVEHEQKLVRFEANPEAPASAAGSPLPEAETVKAPDTLKGMLLQLSAMEDLPMAVRETVREAVQQITGQQLLLTPDRGAAYSHVTLMLPLLHDGGRQTASIHIQSRKGSRGELDAENCHLLFDLDMKTLGSTLVDVQVTDKIVALRVHNDQPFMAELLEAYREEIAAGLGAIGYQFLSLKCLPYPETYSDGADHPETATTVRTGPAAIAAGKYHADPYKGVDVRI